MRNRQNKEAVTDRRNVPLELRLWAGLLPESGPPMPLAPGVPTWLGRSSKELSIGLSAGLVLLCPAQELCMIPFSVLDLAPIAEGATPADAFRNSLELAQHAEEWGYRRFWLAEHHNMPGIASAATAVIIGHVAGGTKTIRVGAGGVMLPNHAPLVIAEQFGTLASLYPGRIDLGLGRAPGAGMPTTRGLRRDSKSTGDDFPWDVQELQTYFEPAEPGQKIRAVPGAGLRVPIWVAGVKLFRRTACSDTGIAVRLCVAFRAHRHDAGTPSVSKWLQTVEAVQAAIHDVGRECHRRCYRRRGAPPFHLAPASLHTTSARNAGANSAADRRHRSVLVSGGEGHGQPVAGLLGGWRNQDGGAWIA